VCQWYPAPRKLVKTYARKKNYIHGTSVPKRENGVELPAKPPSPKTATLVLAQARARANGFFVRPPAETERLTLSLLKKNKTKKQNKPGLKLLTTWVVPLTAPPPWKWLRH